MGVVYYDFCMIWISFKQSLVAGVLVVGGLFILPTLASACGDAIIEMVKSGPARANPGDVIVYTLTGTVTSGVGFSTVIDRIPKGLTFNPGMSYPACHLGFGDASLVACNFTAPAVGQSFSWPVAFNVPANPTQCVVANQVTSGTSIYSSGNRTSNTVITQINCVSPSPPPPPPPGSTPTPSPSPEETPGPTPTPKQEAQLSIDKVDNRENNSTQRGDMITYKFTVKNNGEADIQDLEINDAVPAGFGIDKKSVTSGATFVGQNIRWAGVNLAAGQSRSFTVKVKVTEAAALKGLCNVVTAKSDDHGLSAKDQECVQVKKPPEVKQAIIKAPKAVPVSAKTGGVLTTAIFVALVAAVSAVVWQLKRRGVRIPINWLGGTIIVGITAIVLFVFGGSWIKTQVAFKPSGPTCNCTCQGQDENLLCVDPAGAEGAQCSSYAWRMPAPGSEISLCKALQGLECSFDGVNIGTVTDCNGSS